MLRRLVQILLLPVVFALGCWLMYRYLRPKSRPVESATVLLERIKPVLKLTTVEGQYSEIYSESQGQESWTSYFIGKKAIVRVQATVAAGFDLNNLKIEADSTTHTLRVGPLPAPQILSVDHTIDYYDVSEGIFASFTPEDYNRINLRAKTLIREKAEQGGLLEAAAARSKEMIDLVGFLATSAGWQVEIIGGTPVPPPLQ